jgi:BatD DUF11 like domain
LVALLLVVAVSAQQAPQMHADLDRTTAEVGDEIVLSVQVDANFTEPVELLEQPKLSGLRLRTSSQTSALDLRQGSRVRTTTWEFRLNAVTPGRGTVGPIRVRVGVEELEAPAMVVDIIPVNAANRAAHAAKLSHIISLAPGPDGSDQVTVAVVPWPDSIVLGEQVDLAVVAWFPRDVRARLRTRPTLAPPELQGAWTYAPSAALDVVATREVRGRQYDLFVHHQIVFPLTSGKFIVGPATVSYNLPLRVNILSREVLQEIESRPVTIDVMPQPLANRPPGFGGAAASGLRLTTRIDSSGFSSGGVGTVTATLTGHGNVGLWPEPEFDWPDGLRVYPGKTAVQIDSTSGVVAGTKTFTYVLVADSVGSFRIPPARFPHFDLEARRYREARSEPFSLVSRLVRERSEGTVLLSNLMRARGPNAVTSFIEKIGVLGWIAILLIPPLVTVIVRVAHAWPRRSPVTEELRVPAGMDRLEADFRTALAQLVPDASLRDNHRLAAALQAAGVEQPVAAHAARMRDRLQQAIYGPHGATDPAELTAEALELLKMLPRGSIRAKGFVTVGLMMLVLVPSSVNGQTPEQLYDAGAYRQAADSFRTRTIVAPNEPAHWFNYGMSLYGANDAPRARAAWIRAARLRPRSAEIRAAIRQETPLDPVSQGMMWVAPVTPMEMLAVGIVAWVLGWLMVLTKRRARWVIPVLALAVACAGYAWYTKTRYWQMVALVVETNTPLRVAPYGTATVARTLDRETAVRIRQAVGAWVLIERGDARGWLLMEEVAPI